MNEAWDAGPICLQEELEILPEEDYGTLSRRCAEMGAELVLHSAGLIAEDQEPRTPQDDLQATFAPLIKKEETVIDWRRSSREIKNRIRGLTPIPGARTFWNESVLKIQRSLALNEDSVGALPGEVLAVGPVVRDNLLNLGHLDLKADGLTEPKLPGDVCVRVGDLPLLKPGDAFRITRPADHSTNGDPS